MTQPTIPPNASAESAHSANAEPGKSATTRPARPRRRPAASKAPATQLTAQPAEVAATAPTTAAQKNTAPKAIAPKTSAPKKASTPKAAAPKIENDAAKSEAPTAEAGKAEAATAPAEAKRPRSRGGRSHRGRKNDVQLVVPPTAAEGEVGPEEQSAAPEAVRVVPVTTAEEHDAAITPAAFVPPLAVVTEVAPAEEAAPTRYRFNRRGTAPVAGQTPAARPERLSGPLAVTEPIEAPTQGTAEPEEAEEPWQATVARTAPEALARSVAETSAALDASDLRAPLTAGAQNTIDDLVSALGLRDTTPTVLPMPDQDEMRAASEAEIEAELVADAEAEVEATEEAAEATGEADEDDQTPSRRRRRRRRGSPTAGPVHVVTANGSAEAAAETPPIAPVWPAATGERAPLAPVAERDQRNGFEQYGDFGPFEQPYSPYNRPGRETAPRPAVSPFGSPEPNMARGFGPQPRGVAGPAPTSLPRPARTDRGMDIPPMSSNQLGAMVTHAIQQQTDRMLTELRQQTHGPSMTVAFPAFPSAERVGVFVDVANVVYSARSHRMNVDFGRMLEFLRGNRRVIRAHAYAPTNPEPNAEQAFLTPVRGMGYRVTTKNYKTFATGAKKADMDLDLCMDIVRMVDAKALDTVVLVSGDSDFLPLLEYCSDHGVRVEIAAFDDAAAMILRQSCDLFINLSLVPEIVQ
ncbi:MAG: hypothetical protein OJF49_002525 [Ktedonobacterales bacterium]|jgi:uncharacterized LabA/DUF88 family protein|nr:MAG: hypothetical protein OJF49_002525 [Ktedonobacterales bacterium]